jgi:hypothetical protein
VGGVLSPYFGGRCAASKIIAEEAPPFNFFAVKYRMQKPGVWGSTHRAFALL